MQTNQEITSHLNPHTMYVSNSKMPKDVRTLWRMHEREEKAVTDLREKLRETRSKLAVKERKLKSAQQTIARVLREQQSLVNNHSSTLEHVKKLESQLEVLKNASQLKDQCKKLEIQTSKSAANEEKARLEAETATTSLEQAKYEIECLRRAVNLAAEQLTSVHGVEVGVSLVETAANAQQEASVVSRKLVDCQQDLEQVEAALRQAKEHLKMQRKDLVFWKDRESNQKKISAELEEKCQKLQSINKCQDSVLEELKMKLEHSEGLNSTLQKELKQMETEIRITNQTLVSSDEKIKELSARLKSSNNKVSVLEVNLEMERSARKDAERSVAVMSKEIAEYKLAIAKMRPNFYVNNTKGNNLRCEEVHLDKVRDDGGYTEKPSTRTELESSSLADTSESFAGRSRSSLARKINPNENLVVDEIRKDYADGGIPEIDQNEKNVLRATILPLENGSIEDMTCMKDTLDQNSGGIEIIEEVGMNCAPIYKKESYSLMRGIQETKKLECGISSLDIPRSHLMQKAVTSRVNDSHLRSTGLPIPDENPIQTCEEINQSNLQILKGESSIYSDEFDLYWTKNPLAECNEDRVPHEFCKVNDQMPNLLSKLPEAMEENSTNTLRDSTNLPVSSTKHSVVASVSSKDDENAWKVLHRQLDMQHDEEKKLFSLWRKKSEESGAALSGNDSYAEHEAFNSRYSLSKNQNFVHKDKKMFPNLNISFGDENSSPALESAKILHFGEGEIFNDKNSVSNSNADWLKISADGSLENAGNADIFRGYFDHVSDSVEKSNEHFVKESGNFDGCKEVGRSGVIQGTNGENVQVARKEDIRVDTLRTKATKLTIFDLANMELGAPIC